MVTNGFHGLLRPETADTGHIVLFLLQSKNLVNTVILASKSAIVTTIMQKCLARYKNNYLSSPCCSQVRRPSTHYRATASKTLSFHFLLLCGKATALVSNGRLHITQICSKHGDLTERSRTTARISGKERDRRNSLMASDLIF